MSTYNDENESRPAQGGWYSDEQDAVKPEEGSSSQPADDGSYRIASPKQDSYYQDANYTPQSETTAPQSYYVPNSRDNGGKKEKEKKKGGFTFARAAALCLCCALLGGAAGGGLVYAFSPEPEPAPAATAPVTQVTNSPAPSTSAQGAVTSGALSGNEIYQLAC